jgi:hypothetical protein
MDHSEETDVAVAERGEDALKLELELELVAEAQDRRDDADGALMFTDT